MFFLANAGEASFFFWKQKSPPPAFSLSAKHGLWRIHSYRPRKSWGKRFHFFSLKFMFLPAKMFICHTLRFIIEFNGWTWELPLIALNSCRKTKMDVCALFSPVVTVRRKTHSCRNKQKKKRGPVERCFAFIPTTFPLFTPTAIQIYGLTRLITVGCLVLKQCTLMKTRLSLLSAFHTQQLRGCIS